MPLPYPTKVVLPFDIATAQDMNERHANDVALANGSGLDDRAVKADNVDFTTLGMKVGVIPGSVFSVAGTRTFDTGAGYKPRIIRFTAFPSNSTTSATTMYGVCDGALNQFVWTTHTTGTSSTTSRAGNSSGTSIRLINPGSTISIIAASVTNLSDTGVITFNVSVPASVDIGYEIEQ